MPRFLEQKLKKEYGADSDIPYKVMNKLGVMKGNKETAKGKAEEKKHKMAKKMKFKLPSLKELEDRDFARKDARAGHEHKHYDYAD